MPDIVIKIVLRECEFNCKQDKQPALVELNISSKQKTSNKANTLLQMMIIDMKKNREDNRFDLLWTGEAEKDDLSRRSRSWDLKDEKRPWKSSLGRDLETLRARAGYRIC